MLPETDGNEELSLTQVKSFAFDLATLILPTVLDVMPPVLLKDVSEFEANLAKPPPDDKWPFA